MQIKPGNFCPLIGETVKDLNVLGIKSENDPQTGEPVDEWGCAVTWMPMLLIENSQQQRSTSAGVESFLVEMVKANSTNIDVLSAAAQMLSQARDQK